MINRTKDITKGGLSAVTEIALERKEKKQKKFFYNTGYLYLATQPNSNSGKQGLPLFSGWDSAILGNYDSMLNTVFHISNFSHMGKSEKQITYICWENKERKNRKENDN